jgi:hypothetical protein
MCTQFGTVPSLQPLTQCEVTQCEVTQCEVTQYSVTELPTDVARGGAVGWCTAL